MRRPASIGRVLEVVRKEFRQMFRDPRVYRVIFIAPVLQLLVFGYAVSTDVRNTRAFVVDHDRSEDSRQFLEAFTASGYFHLGRFLGAGAEWGSAGPGSRLSV